MREIDQQVLRLLALHPDGLRASEMQELVLPNVSQPTLWRRLDDLRSRGEITRTGRGRATRYLPLHSRHSITDMRSKALHMEVGKKLIREPALLENARIRLERMRGTAPHAKKYIEQWEELVAGPLERVLRVLGSDEEHARALRHTSPFAGLLSEQERLDVLRRQGLAP